MKLKGSTFGWWLGLALALDWLVVTAAWPSAADPSMDAIFRPKLLAGDFVPTDNPWLAMLGVLVPDLHIIWAVGRASFGEILAKTLLRGDIPVWLFIMGRLSQSAPNWRRRLVLVLLSIAIFACARAFYLGGSDFSTWRLRAFGSICLFASPMLFISRREARELYERVVRGRIIRTMQFIGDELKRRAGSSKSGDPTVQPKLFWGGHEIPDAMLEPHFSLVGVTGSGKTLSMRMLMRSVLTTVGTGSMRCRAAVYDPKRDMFPILCGLGVPKHRILLVNAFDKRGKAWDIGKDITTPGQAQQCAKLLVPGPDDAGANTYWYKASADVLRTAIMALQATKKDKWGLSELVSIACDLDELRALLSTHAEGRRALRIHQLDESGYVVHGTHGPGIMSTLRTEMVRYQTVGLLWSRCGPEDRFSVREWLDPKKPKRVIIVGTDADNSAALDPINRAIFQRMTDAVADRLGERPSDETWFFIDELRLAERLNGLQRLLVGSRSKGGRIVLGFQGIEGLQLVYGDKGAEEVLGQCGNLAILRLQSPASMEWAARFFGKQDYVKESVTYQKSETSGTSSSTTSGVSVQMSIEERDSIKPAEFGELGAPKTHGRIEGYYFVPGLGSWKGVSDMSEVLRRVGDVSKDPGFDPRDPSDQLPQEPPPKKFEDLICPKGLEVKE